uniref:Uncharacterized protein n=1 Tax=Panagrolaimus davidi TaxID=227884 RepID=A0A914PUK9_9BILA
MNESEIEKFLKDNMAKAEATVRLNQSTPVPRPYRNPLQERMSWRFQVLQNDMQQVPRDNLVSTRTTILSGDSHSCKKALEELKEIKLRDMKVPMVHSGRYLVCRVIGAPCLMVGVNTLVEDLNGDVEQLALYNFRYNINDLEWISFGTILVIKEPWLRYGSQSKTPSMRVDSPTDVIFVDPADEKLLEKIGAKKW